jgi:hypothetical protein
MPRSAGRTRLSKPGLANIARELQVGSSRWGDTRPVGKKAEESAGPEPRGWMQVNVKH